MSRKGKGVNDFVTLVHVVVNIGYQALELRRCKRQQSDSRFTYVAKLSASVDPVLRNVEAEFGNLLKHF